MLKEEAKDRICMRLPEFCKKTAVFVINCAYVRQPEDALVDGNRVFPHAEEIKWKAVKIEERNTDGSKTYGVKINAVGKEAVKGKTAMRTH